MGTPVKILNVVIYKNIGVDLDEINIEIIGKRLGEKNEDKCILTKHLTKQV